ncbi:hypothetical protein, partial [Flavobacterium sp. LMO9]|uniref:hypothetical protein n=1 Tax=Flavobacterium sp. LMO9 TaxID=2654245 RepID=UPI0019398634
YRTHHTGLALNISFTVGQSSVNCIENGCNSNLIFSNLAAAQARLVDTIYLLPAIIFTFSKIGELHKRFNTNCTSP